MGDFEISTLLPIDRWAQIVGLDPRHFRQVTSTCKPTSSCAQVWKEHPWQENDAISRDDVTIAVQQAEDTFADLLNFKVLPDWTVSEKAQCPQPADRSLYNKYAMDLQGFSLSRPLRWGHFIEGGVKTLTLIDDAVAVTYSDADADGCDETATITFATTVTDEQQLAIFYPGENTSNWEIRPFRTCVIAAGVATMTFWKWQFVEPDLIEAVNPSDVADNVAANFLRTVDVYRRYTLPTNMCSLIWDPQSGSCSDECCEVESQTACLVVRDWEYSIVGYQPAEYDAVTEAWTSVDLSVARNPERLSVCYFSGYRDTRRPYPVIQMDPEFERAIVYYSLTLLTRDMCGCSNVEALQKHWTTDLALKQGGTSYEVSSSLLDNPLGTTRAAVNAWNLIRRRALVRPVDF